MKPEERSTSGENQAQAVKTSELGSETPGKGA